jgi:cytochrome P450
VRPIVNALIDEFIDSGETDLIKNFTFEFPTRVIAKLLGLPEEDLPLFRKWAVDLISYTVKYTQAFESSAALKDYFLVQTEGAGRIRPRTSSATSSPRRSTARG